MTAHILRFRQRHFGAVILSATVALALSACSSSNQEATQASEPTAAATAQSQQAATAPATATGRFVAYAAVVSATPVNAQCALDTINAKPAADVAPLVAGSDAVFAGWAGNGKGQVANGFLLVLKGAQSYSSPITTDVPRADVVKALSSEGMANSGFGLSASLIGVAAGSYQLFVVDPADATNACDLHRSITVQ